MDRRNCEIGQGVKGPLEGSFFFPAGWWPMAVLLLFFFSHAGLSKAETEGFYHTYYEVDMSVHLDNRYSVCETMEVEFSTPHHGLVREWPQSVYVKRRLDNGRGAVVERVMHYDVNLKNATASEHYELESADGFQVMRIGNPDSMVTGAHDYVLNYDYEVGNDRVPHDDLFYYSLIGNDNASAIRELRFNIRFDAPLPPEALKGLRLFCGVQGDTVNKASELITTLSDTLISGTVQGLSPHEAVTLYVPLPEGYFSAVDAAGDKAAVWWILTSLAVLALVILMVRECKLRNNYTKVIECWPPEGLSSADIGYIYDTKVDPRDIISLIPYFAHRDLLAIDATSGHPVLNKTGEMPDGAPDYQRKFFNALFSDGDSFDTAHPSSQFAKAWLSMERGVKAANKGMGNRYSLHVLWGFLASVLVVFALGTGDATGTDTIVGYGMVVLFLMGYIAFSSMGWWDSTKGHTFRRLLLLLSWGGAVYGQYALIRTALADVEVLVSPAQGYMLLSIYLLFLIDSLRAYKLVSMSPARLKKIGYILGLKEFIEKSEKPMLDSLVREHEQYFYDILPYAVAFNLAEKWAAQFEGMALTPPSWYKGRENAMPLFISTMQPSALYSRSMSRSVQKQLESEARASSLSASRSSAHFGSVGGFSGGGFGGGGCHGW